MKEVIAGVPLAQYAAVTAALAEAFPLRAVLTVEGLALSQWAEADRGWTEQLDKDPSLLALYEAELTAARERMLSREEPPEGDKATAPLRAGKAKLVRSGAGLSPLLAMSNAAAGVSDVHAPAPMPMMPSGLAVEPPLPLHVVPPAFAPEPPPAMVPMPPSVLGDPRGGPAPRRDDGFTMVGMQVSSAVLPFRAAAELGAESADGDPHMETVAVRVPASSALPFGGSAQQAPPPSAPSLYGTPFKAASQAAPSPAPSAPSLYGTPFKAAAPSPAPSTPSVPSAEQPAWEEDEHKETAAIRLPAAASALPFQRSEAAPPPAPSAPSLYGTPFKAASQAAPSPSAPAAEARAWSHAAALEPEEYSQDEWGVAPPARSPRIMPLEQHASLCLEIALDPARAGEIMARYGVTDAEKAVSDEHYRARIAAEPEIGAQWHRAYAAYHAWLTSRSAPA